MTLLPISDHKDMAFTTKAMFMTALDKYGSSHIADVIGLHPNTLKRWVEMDVIPSNYHDDIARILGYKTQKKGVDQFFTKPDVAKKCWEKFQLVCEDLNVKLNKYHFIEPSAGCGWFYFHLPPRRRIGLDIEPRLVDGRANELIQHDFLTWYPSKNRKYAVVGNPPFGLRGHLALQFINHAAKFSDLVAFILPQLFESDGKGVPSKRVRGLKLAHTEALDAESFLTPDGKPLSIPTIFQVWTRVNTDRITIKPKLSCSRFITIYSLSDGGTPSTTRNKEMLYECDVYLPSTCYTNMKAYKCFENLHLKRGYGIVIHEQKRAVKKLLMNHDWEKTAFRSTNSALNLRRSVIESVLTRNGYHD